MKYVCSICGYVYDEDKESLPFPDLSESWVCPLCGAPKSLFETEKKEDAPPKPIEKIEAVEDMHKLPAGVLSAICSNLARGCEKQYHEEEASLFKELANYFAQAAPEETDATVDTLYSLLENDLKQGYPGVSSAAKEVRDRGTQRICVWGEKVTNILYSLVQRYKSEGPDFLKNTSIWVCSVCGFVYLGDTPPAICPVCKVPDWKFDKVEGRSFA